jgi:hypothetical protein
MGLTKEARAKARERERVSRDRWNDRCSHQERVHTTVALVAIKSEFPDFKSFDNEGNEGLFDEDVGNLPKWFGDIIDKVVTGRFGDDGLHEIAEAAADAAADKAYDDAFSAAYEATYTKAFNDAFALSIARHKGRTYYDDKFEERIRVDGPDAENVVPLIA